MVIIFVIVHIIIVIGHCPVELSNECKHWSVGIYKSCFFYLDSWEMNTHCFIYFPSLINLQSSLHYIHILPQY